MSDKEQNEQAEKQKCDSCGDYNNRGTGKVMVECCGRCNELWFVGICNMCNGTGFVQPDGVSNFEMINEALHINGGYFCDESL